MDLNNCSFTGRLGKDPEMRYTSTGSAVTSFSLAVTLSKDDTLWLEVSAWGKQAEATNQYMAKGYPVAVSGRLLLEKWEGRDGQMRQTLKLVANNVVFLPNKQEGQGKQAVASKPQPQAASQQADPISVDSESKMPF